MISVSIPVGEESIEGDLVLPDHAKACLLYTSQSPRDPKTSRMPSSA